MKSKTAKRWARDRYMAKKRRERNIMYIKFPSIGQFHNVVRLAHRKCPSEHVDGELYRAKIKLHGTNAGVAISKNGIVKAQKRTGGVTTGNDNFEFAAWVEKNEALFAEYKSIVPDDCDFIIINGEWAGPGVQKKVSISEIETKSFFVFSVTYAIKDTERDDYHIVICPIAIDILLSSNIIPKNMYTIPWFTSKDAVHEWDLRFNDTENLKLHIAEWNREIEFIEECDPYVHAMFDIKGLGEGMVFYAINKVNTLNDFSEYVFKVKGQKHAVNKQKAPVLIDPEVLEAAGEFCDMFVTENRLNQMFEQYLNNEIDIKLVGKLIGVTAQDILKESTDEREVMKCEWKHVAKEIGQRTKDWYFKKLEEF